MWSSTRLNIGTTSALLFLLYVNDLPNASKILDPIMFADDTNLFFSNCNIQVLFATAELVTSGVPWKTKEKKKGFQSRNY